MRRLIEFTESFSTLTFKCGSLVKDNDEINQWQKNINNNLQNALRPLQAHLDFMLL